MVLNDMLRSLLRRWYIVLLGVIVTAGGVVGAYMLTPVTFTAASTVVLLPPEKSVEDGDNPYLYLGGLGQALNVLVITMNSEASQEALIGSEPGQSFTLGQDPTTTGPIIQIEVEAPTAQQAVALARTVTARIPKTLDALQNELKVPADAKIGTMTLAESQEAQTANRRQLQLMVLAAGGGLVATVLIVAALDKHLAKRKQNKTGRRTGRTGGGTGGGTDGRPGDGGRDRAPNEPAAQPEQREPGDASQPVHLVPGR